MNVPELQFILDNKYKAIPRYIKFHWPEFYEYLQTHFPGLRFSEQLYQYFYGTPSPCPICDRPTKYINITRGYSKYCSCRCAANDPDIKAAKIPSKPRSKQKPYTPEERRIIQAKRHQTNIERYGETYNEQFASRRHQTNIERYGTTEYFASSDFKSKAGATCLGRYGVANVSNLPDIRAKIAESNRITQNLPDVRAKIEQTCLERYGSTSPASNPQIAEQIRSTTVQRYGGIGMASPVIRTKIQSTNQAKYGHSSYQAFVAMDNHDFLLRVEDGKWVCRCPHPECTKCTERTFITSSQHYWARKSINVEQCTNLLPIKAKTSMLEIFIKGILDRYNIRYTQQDSTLIPPKAVDFYLPDYKLVIECNGYYWHSTTFKQPSEHINRYKSLHQQGIQCITFWEDWIMNAPEIVESIILSKTGRTQRIGARKCECRIVDKRIGNQFLLDNHIQGNAKSTIMYGLYYNDELISLMTFLKSGTSWGLERYCNKINYTIVGGASKLLKQFINDHHPEHIYSFSSCDISNGHLYKVLGFTSDYKISKSYWYIDPKTIRRYHRKNFSKDAIVKKGLRPNKIGWTEKDVINELKLHTIYDSGTIRWDLFPK